MLSLIPRRNNHAVSTSNSLFDSIENFFNDDFFNMPMFSRNEFKIDVKENDNAYTIEADLPGVNKEDIGLDYNNGTLYIGVKHNEEVNEENSNYIHRERSTTSMQRGIYLGDVNVNAIDAKLDNGVLKIIAPKNEVTSNRPQIEIK